MNYGYSYWPKINNSAGSTSMYVVVGLNQSRGGPGPSLFKIDGLSIVGVHKTKVPEFRALIKVWDSRRRDF